MAAGFDYLIIGGGMVADAAARGIREKDTNGSIGILSEDVDEPYARPALSKKLWTDDDFDWDQTDLHTSRDTDAQIRLKTTVTKLNRETRSVETADGDEVSYGVLLFATGGHPKQIDLPDDDRVIYFRSAEDYRRLRQFAADGAHVAVVGGSYIGQELAAALVQNGATVTLIFPEGTLGASVFPPDLAAHFQSVFADAGVALRPNATVTRGVASGDGIDLTLSAGGSLSVDAVVSGLGIEPAVEVAEQAGLQVRDGIVVDTYLCTTQRGIYAAGDVASYPDRILGRRRVEHVDNAKEMGNAVGHLMTGDVQPYLHTPYYYSTVLGMSYEAVGTLDSSLETIEDWTDPLEKGVIYYLHEAVVSGVLLWNVTERRDEARRVLKAGLGRGDLRGAIDV